MTLDPAFKVFILWTFNKVVFLIDTVTLWLLGWSFSRGTSNERELARSYYDYSAQLVTVVANANFVPGYPLPRNGVYIYKHDKYIDPRMVLENDNIILSHFTKDEAIFGVGDPGKKINDTTVYPFQVHSVFHGCSKHIRMPISSFYRLCEDFGEPKVKIGVCVMTPRSGSTLLNQIMNKVPGTRSLSEPMPVDALWYMFRTGVLDWEEVRKRLQGTIKMLAKTSSDSDVKRVFMKLAPYGAPLCGLMHELFPTSFFMLSTRHPMPSLLSFRKIWAIFGTGIFGLSSQCWRAQGWKMCFLRKKNKYDKIWNLVKPWRQPVSFDIFASLIYDLSLASAKDHGNIFQQVGLYEDLVANPSTIVKHLFKNMGIEEDISIGLTAMEIESQNGTFSYQVNRDVSSSLIAEVTNIYKDFHLDFSFDCTLVEFRRFLRKSFPNAQY